ncbi:hypothetical protein KIPB_013970, partial [Kipferlia bialata]|eukprot:g13970.t1
MYARRPGLHEEYDGGLWISVSETAALVQLGDGQ